MSEGVEEGLFMTKQIVSKGGSERRAVGRLETSAGAKSL